MKKINQTFQLGNITNYDLYSNIRSSLFGRSFGMKQFLNKITLGDSLELLKEIPDNFIACIFTDVPYTINGGKGWDGLDEEKNKRIAENKIFEHNDINPTEYLPDLYRVLEDTGHIYLMTNSLHLAEIQKLMEEVGFIINNILVMVKNNSVANQHYMKNCEFTIFARKGGSKGLNDFGIKSAISVIMPNGENKIHETEKPKDYIKKLVGNSTKKGDICLDPFTGSGSTANACVDLGINFISFEIDENKQKTAQDRIDQAFGNVGLFA